MLAIVQKVLSTGLTPAAGCRGINNLASRALEHHDWSRIAAENTLVRKVDFSAESRLCRAKLTKYLFVRHVDSRSAQRSWIGARARPPCGWLSFIFCRQVYISGQARHLARVIGFLETIRLFVASALAELLNKKVLFLDGAGARLGIGTTHGKLHCTVKARDPPEPRFLSNNRTLC
ncbi:hypothetical protein [Stenotrophomonas rhizophila]|uniref:hypothetical protein n=1 Tax=Stenotrophomonas rhizophila TaxID=216778 RepID=UPI00211B5B0C|nr:hypothetical protein [Stenotrophomonas rhizophila]